MLRKTPAHPTPVERGNQTIVVFVTVCAAFRKPIFANAPAVKTILDAWGSADHWLIGKYIILPEHIHFFCAPGRLDALPLLKWIAFWKSKASRHWPDASQQPIWQTDGWDTQLRSGDSYAAKWEYVRQNPVRHRLARVSEGWPWQGELNILEWHER